ncbi:MAG: allantoinase AllB [Actinomycetia bacterium]|nr:allantoinase AllB [Actinomycetes bacterium]
MAELLVRSDRIVLTDDVLDGWLLVRNGTIVAIGSGEGPGGYGGEVLDARGRVVLPGAIDTHVHVRYPGHAEREDFVTGTRAAAAGGVTTILEMPISVPPVYDVDILERRLEAARRDSLVDFAFYGAGGHQALDHIQALSDAGVVGYKIFMHRPQAGREAEFEGLWSANSAHLYQVFEAVARAGRVACLHAEDDEILALAERRLRQEGRHDARAHLEAHPVLAEALAIDLVVRLSEATGARVSICHLSSGTGADIVAAAKARGVPITAETCPHYLFRTEEAMERLGPYAKINPPLRSAEEQERLWRRVQDGTVDFVGSDHAPYTPEEKEPGWESIWRAPAGCPGLETLLPLMAQATVTGGLSFQDVARLTATRAAGVFGLAPRKGRIAVGADADLAVLAPEPWTVSAAAMHTKHPQTARLFEGERLDYRVDTTVVRGHIVYRRGEIVGRPGDGRWQRPPAPSPAAPRAG